MPRASAASTADRDTVLADSHHQAATHDAVAAVADNEDEQLEDDDDDDDDDDQEIYGESPRAREHPQGAACADRSKRAQHRVVLVAEH